MINLKKPIASMTFLIRNNSPNIPINKTCQFHYRTPCMYIFSCIFTWLTPYGTCGYARVQGTTCIHEDAVDASRPAETSGATLSQLIVDRIRGDATWESQVCNVNTSSCPSNGTWYLVVYFLFLLFE